MAALSPMLETPTGDSDVDAIALMGYAYALIMLDRTDDALAAANRAAMLARDQATVAFAHIGVGFLHLARGDVERGIEESERGTALARAAGPAATAYASLMEAQARLTGGDLDRAAALLAEGELIGAPVDAKLLWNIDTLHGDLAMRRGRPRQALEHYSRSLTAAEARGDDLQVLFDLLGTANALAALEDDEPALEVAGLAEALNAEMVGDVTSYFTHLLGTDPAEASERRLGAEEARRCKALGHAQASARRVARACELARG